MLRHATRFADPVLDPGEELGVIVDEPLGALVAPRLFVGQDREDKVAGRTTATVRLEDGADHHRDPALHVEGPPSP